MSRLSASSQRLQPSLETLEDRCCPTGLSLNNGTLNIINDNTGSKIFITQDDANDTLRVDSDVTIGGNKILIPSFFKSSEVHNISLDLNDTGGDLFQYKLKSDLTSGKSFEGHFGYGNNDVTLALDQAHIKADVSFAWFMHPFDLSPTRPTPGSSTLVVNIGEVDSANVNLDVAFGGGSNNIGNVHLNGDLKGKADVNLGLFGGAGHDLIEVTATGQPRSHSGLRIDPNARLEVYLDGNGGNDNVDFKYAGVNKGRIDYHVDAGGDPGDAVFVSIVLRPGSTGKVVQIS
jgi:hypothetical protein